LTLALDKNGDIYVGGQTNTSEAFPFTNILYTSGQGFLVKFHGVDGTLSFAAELGGAPKSIFVDAKGQALFTMSTILDVPVTPGAYSHGGPRKSFAPATLMHMVRLSPAGDRILLSARYSGDAIVCASPMLCQDTSPVTHGNQIMQDAQGNIWIAGSTNTTDLPVTPNTLKSTCGCSQFSGDGFLAEFSNDGSKLLYATYFGTTPSDVLASDGQDDVTAAVMDSVGHIWIVGSTKGSDLPVTSNAIQQHLSGGWDGFLAQYDPATNELLYVSYFGGTADDGITNVQIAPDTTVVFTGHSSSTTLPVPASGFTRGTDFLAVIDPQSHMVNFLTTFASGSAGTGLSAAPGNSEVISGTSNVATVLQSGDATMSLYAVTNSANLVATGQVARGELITLFGANIGPVTPFTADLSSGFAPKQLGGVQVLVQNAPVSLLYAQLDQINAIVPFQPATSLESPNMLTLTVLNAAESSNVATLGLIDADPQPFTSNPPFAAALNQDGTVNSSSNPAAAGSTVSVFAYRFGRFLTATNRWKRDYGSDESP
jgi:hypothetical protein